MQIRTDILRIGYFGSYARGDWGVNSDLDLILIVESSDIPFWERALEWDVNCLPVPVDILVYTQKEWQDLISQDGRFARMITREAVWIYQRDITWENVGSDH